MTPGRRIADPCDRGRLQPRGPISGARTDRLRRLRMTSSVPGPGAVARRVTSGRPGRLGASPASELLGPGIGRTKEELRTNSAPKGAEGGLASRDIT